MLSGEAGSAVNYHLVILPSTAASKTFTIPSPLARSGFLFSLKGLHCGQFSVFSLAPNVQSSVWMLTSHCLSQ